MCSDLVHSYYSSSAAIQGLVQVIKEYLGNKKRLYKDRRSSAAAAVL